MTERPPEPQSPAVQEAIQQAQLRYNEQPAMVYCNCLPGMCSHYQERARAYEAHTEALEALARVAREEADAKIKRLERAVAELAIDLYGAEIAEGLKARAEGRMVPLADPMTNTDPEGA